MLRTTVSASLTASVAMIAIGWLPIDDFVVDTLCQLRMLFIFLSVALMVLALSLRMTRRALLVSLVLMANIWELVPLPMEAHPFPSRSLKIISANVWAGNGASSVGLADWISAEQPDVVCLQETDKEWLEQFHLQCPDYKFIIGNVSPRNSIILSKVPLEAVVTNEVQTPSCLRAVATVGGRKVLLMNVHTSSPVNERAWYMRNGEMHKVAKFAKQSSLPLVALGDFNCVSWSSNFRELVRSSNLRNTEKTFGIQPSWNVAPLPAILPIDHCLTSANVSVLDRHMGPNVGSDHLPMVVTLAL